MALLGEVISDDDDDQPKEQPTTKPLTTKPLTRKALRNDCGSTLGRGLLHMAAVRSDLTAAEQLLDPNSKLFVFDVDKRSRAGVTPLMEAASRGHCEMVSFLVDRGADVNVCDDGSWSPLNYAAFCGHDECADLLVELGAAKKCGDSSNSNKKKKKKKKKKDDEEEEEEEEEKEEKEDDDEEEEEEEEEGGGGGEEDGEKKLPPPPQIEAWRFALLAGFDDIAAKLRPKHSMPPSDLFPQPFRVQGEKPLNIRVKHDKTSKVVDSVQPGQHVRVLERYVPDARKRTKDWMLVVVEREIEPSDSESDEDMFLGDDDEIDEAQREAEREERRKKRRAERPTEYETIQGWAPLFAKGELMLSWEIPKKVQPHPILDFIARHRDRKRVLKARKEAKEEFMSKKKNREAERKRAQEQAKNDAEAKKKKKKKRGLFGRG